MEGRSHLRQPFWWAKALALCPLLSVNAFAEAKGLEPLDHRCDTRTEFATINKSFGSDFI